MPSALNYPREHSIQLHFKKKSGKWTKRFVVIRKSSDVDPKYYLDIYPYHRPVARAIRKLGPGTSVEVEISLTYSHAVVTDTDTKNGKLLTLVPLTTTKQSQLCYQFAAYTDEEVRDLKNLEIILQTLCEITSFEVSVDADSNSCIPAGPAFLHIYNYTACLTSRSPCFRVLHTWQPGAEFHWERQGFRIIDFQHSNQQCFLFVHSQEDMKKIQKEISDRTLYSFNSEKVSCEDVAIVPTDPSLSQTGNHGAQLDKEFLPLNGVDTNMPIRNGDIEKQHKSENRRSTSSAIVKENVEIRFPSHKTTQRCYSDPTIQQSNPKETIKPLTKSHSFDRKNDKNRSYELEMVTIEPLPSKKSDLADEKKDLNVKINQCSDESFTGSDIIQDPIQYYANVQLRPKFYMYMNVSKALEQEPEAPYTYVNIFSGSSFKGCYENWQLQSRIYSTIPAAKPPPLPPRPYPPKLPPRTRQHPDSCGNSVVQPKPPPLPPKPKSPTHCINPSETCAAPRIQVALFAATPVSGRVWFLRVAFMHQDENDTTFKRVKDIEAFSNHRLLKTNSLEVTSDIFMEVSVNSKQGFVLLNGNQQNIELNDIGDLSKGDWFVVEFHIQNSDETQDHLIGNVSIGPNSTNCRRACKADMGIDEIFQRKIMHPTATQMKKSLLSDYNRRTKLCRALDIINSQNHDWRQVAGSLGFTHAEIIELQDKACRNVTFSPTDEVLKIWEQREPNCNIEQLVNVLRELGRLDVVQDLGYSITLES